MNRITINQALQQGIQQLQQAGIPGDTLKLDCEILLLLALNQNPSEPSGEKTKTWLLTWPEYILSPAQLQCYQSLLEQRSTGKPVAYITGEKEFWSFTLRVTADTLIPRPETELLVETALEKIPLSETTRILDLGTGSGAIALAIASERPDARVVASDNSPAALTIARENAHRLDIQNIRFCLSDWFDSISAPASKQGFDMIVSNPPYIAHDDPQLEAAVREFEPGTALLAKDNGLRDISQIIHHCPAYLKPGGWLILEHGYTQGDEVQQRLAERNATNISTIKDLNNLARVTLGQFN